MSETPTDIREADFDAVRRVQAGDVEAFALLVRRHEARVRALCASMLNGSGDAEDAAQESFLKAYRHLADFRGDALFSTWMHRIAYRHCLDLQKARRRRPAESLDALLEKGDGVLARAQEPAPDAGTVAELLAGLPDDYRQILLMRESHGFRYEEIAAATGVSLDSVKARLRRARRRLIESARHLWGGAVVQQAGEPS